MGQIIFKCKSCGTKLSAELDEAGADFECPKCGEDQVVPGNQTAGSAQTSPGTPVHTRASSGVPVVHIPKRKITLSTPDEDEEEEEYEDEEVGGMGLALFAVALGTAGLILCVISMVWMFVSRGLSDSWWISLLVFLATFLMGLMGLVLAQLARLVVRLADRVSQLGYDEEE
ncbi:MAG: hypothetical protein BWY59_01002 [Verrucomicrobia bacterium ADurb.Bin345]|nr:MAG: hypothetical protein BWY59_01002 [Verrucomicrobia bacterium ADurb.Bin345]